MNDNCLIAQTGGRHLLESPSIIFESECAVQLSVGEFVVATLCLDDRDTHARRLVRTLWHVAASHIFIDHSDMEDSLIR